MLWEVDVFATDPANDHAARAVVAGAADLGIAGCRAARTVGGWLVEGNLARADIERVAAELLVDPVTESCAIFELADGVAAAASPDSALPLALHVLPKPGVTDPAAQSALEAMRLLGVSATAVRSVRKFWLPATAGADAERLAWKLLASDAIHEVVVGDLRLRALSGGQPWTFSRVEVPLEGLDDAALAALSRERCLALTPAELAAVRDHFRALGRAPSEIELETIAQTWSEHCCHKTLSSPVDHVGPDGQHRYENLLKETVFAATRKVREALGRGDWCVSVFRDNSGVVRFDGDHDICVKVETHNHPSAIEIGRAHV